VTDEHYQGAVEGDIEDIKETALAVQEHLPDKPLTADGVRDITEQLRLMGELRRAVIGLTTETQWVDFGGHPYMEGDAAYTIASGIGLRFEEPQYEFHDLGAGAWQCVCTQAVERNGRRYVDHGDCDSFDDFFAKRRGELERNGATPEAISRVLRAEAMKKARANAISRVVSGWTGLRGLSWDDLERLGLQRGRAGAVKFRQGSAGGKTAGEQALADALQLPKGSKCDIRASVIEGTQKQGAKGPYCLLTLRDGDAEVRAVYWKARPDWLSAGVGVYASVTIDEYQGKPQLKIDHLEELGADDEQSTPDGSDDDGSGYEPPAF
jgi:hypothetical protein